MEQWTLLLERGKNLPDTLIYLQDGSPNGDFLTQRCYSLKKMDIDERIRNRKDRMETIEGYFHFRLYFFISFRQKTDCKQTKTVSIVYILSTRLISNRT